MMEGLLFLLQEKFIALWLGGCPLFMIAVAPMIAIIAPSLASNYLRKCFRDDGNVNTPIAVCLTSLVRHHCWSLNKDQSVFFISAIEAIG